MRLTGKVSGREDSGEYGPPHHKEVDSYAQRNCTTTETMRVEPLAGALTKRQKYDYRDIDRRELKLIRVGQAIFALYKRERRFPGSTGVQQKALLEACETIWALKKQLRAELRVERVARFALWRDRTLFAPNAPMVNMGAQR